MKLLNIIYNEINAWLFALVRWLPGNGGHILRSAIYRKRFKTCGRNISIGMGCYIHGSERISLGNNINIGLNAQIYAAGTGKEIIEIGDNVNTNSNIMINADMGGCIKLGRNVLLGPNVVLRASNHKFSDPNVPIKKQGHEAGKIIIEEDVWLGANVTVVPNVTIGRGSVVAAGAVVTKDVEAFSVVGGVPARMISKRGGKRI